MLQIVNDYKFDGDHFEDEVKAMKILKYIMNDYEEHHHALINKKIADNKWCVMEQRNALIPRDLDDRWYWVKVMELLLKLKEVFIQMHGII